MDNGKISTQLISIGVLIGGALLSYFLKNPDQINQIMAMMGMPNEMILVIAPIIGAIILVIYNAYYPRKVEEKDAFTDEGA